MQPFVPKDTTFTKIFVGGLSYQTTDETLRQYFERFGEIEEAVVITDRQTGKSRGYGFVTMHTKEAASQAVCDPNPVIDGRKANVNLAYLGAKPRMLPSSAGIIPVQITNAYHALAAGTGYGVQPICYQPTQSLISTQPSLLLSAAGATSAPSGSQLIDLALQCPSPNLCQTHISLLDAAARTMPQAAAFYTTGAYSNSASAAALTVPGSSLQQFTVHPAHPTNALTYSTNGVFGNGLAAAAAQYPTAAFDNTGI